MIVAPKGFDPIAQGNALVVLHISSLPLSNWEIWHIMGGSLVDTGERNQSKE